MTALAERLAPHWDDAELMEGIRVGGLSGPHATAYIHPEAVRRQYDFSFMLQYYKHPDNIKVRGYFRPLPCRRGNVCRKWVSSGRYSDDLLHAHSIDSCAARFLFVESQVTLHVSSAVRPAAADHGEAVQVHQGAPCEGVAEREPDHGARGQRRQVCLRPLLRFENPLRCVIHPIYLMHLIGHFNQPLNVEPNTGPNSESDESNSAE